MDADEVRMIGWRIRRIRDDRQKALRVVAGLAGMSASTLWRIEHGKRALRSRAEVVALANALGVPPSDLTRLPVPAPVNGNVDSAIEEVRLALRAVSRHRPGGRVVSVEELRARARAVENMDYRSRGVVLPGLVRDLHTTLAAGRHVAELLDLAVLLHAQTTRGWLYIVGAPLDLCWEAATLPSRQPSAERNRPRWVLPRGAQ